MWLSREPWSRLTAPPSLRGAHRLWHFPTGDSCVGLAQHFRGFPLKDILGPMVACKIYVLIPPKQMTPDVERNLSVGIEIFRRAGTYASAFGWVGVLIGLAIISKNATPYNLEELRPCLIYLYSSRTLWDCLALPGLPSYPHQTLSDTGRSGNTSVIDQFGRSLCPVC